MTISASDKKIIRITQIFLGLCCFIIAAAGSANTFSLQWYGIKTQANVIEVVVDQHYRTTPWKHSVDYYKIKLQFMNQQGSNQVQWTQVEADDKERFHVAAGAQVPFIYIPGHERSMIGSEPPSWTECIIANVIFIFLGCFFLCLAIFKKE